MSSVSKLQYRFDEPTEFTAYVRKEGKVTVPKEVRDALNIARGDLVRCKIMKVKV